MRVLDDADVARLLTPEVAVDAAREAVLAAYRGDLVAPPRLRANAGDTELVFTVGGAPGGPSGFRVYGLWPDGGDQLVAVWEPGGRLSGVVTGSRLGACRTGALGGVAVDVLAPVAVPVLAVVGTGTQAWTQLWAASAVRRPGEVRVTSRDPERRAAFADRARAELGLPIEAVGSVREAVAEAASVIVATTSAAPVLDAAWLQPDCHVTTVGPKATDGSELPTELFRSAALVVSDSPAQLADWGDPLWDDVEVAHLGAAVAGDLPVQRLSTGLRIYSSAGLAGSEVVLAARLLALG